MRSGAVPARSSRATRSVSTRVLPEPALAVSQVERCGSAARTCARVASSIIAEPLRLRGFGRVPFAMPRQVVVIAGVIAALHGQPRGKAALAAQIAANQGDEAGPGLLGEAGGEFAGFGPALTPKLDIADALDLG